MLFFNRTIRKKVLAVIEARIAEAQKQYDEEVDRLDEKLVQDLKALREKRLADVEQVANEMVKKVLSFF